MRWSSFHIPRAALPAILLGAFLPCLAWAQDNPAGGNGAPIEEESEGIFGSKPKPTPPPPPAKPPETKNDSSQEARKPVKASELIKRNARTDLDAMMLRGVTTVPISGIVDETIDDLIADLNKLDTMRISPLAIRMVEVSPNLKANFARDVEQRITAAIAQSTTIKQVWCTACRSMRSRVEHGEWVVSLGPVTQKDLAQLGADIGVRSFLEVDFIYESGTNVVQTRARIVRAEDGAILWSESYTSDTTTAALIRGEERTQTRSERKEELQRLIDGRPAYGYAASAGITSLPYSTGDRSTAIGITGGIRLFERFGPQKRSLFGVDLQGYVNVPVKLFGAFVGMTYMYELTEKSLHLPDIRVGGSMGGFLVGTEGNTFYFEGGAEAMLKWRFGVGASLLYALPVKYLNNDLGGLGYRVKMVFVW
jgi:hypothetical protein